MRTKPDFGCNFLVCLIAAASSGAPAWSQSDTIAAQATLEEVIVTSRKRQEDLQDIPESVSAFDAEAIANARIENIADAIAFTPSVTLIQDEQPASSTIAIRGVGQNRSGEPPVAFVVDGVPLGNSYEFMQDLFDIERIEVLKGPQGSLYGRNAIGGAINITTREPSDVFEGRGMLRVARGDEIKFGASISGPIAYDRAYFRIGGTVHESDGLITNITANRKVDYLKDRSVRARLLLTPTEELRLDFTGFYNRYRGGAAWWAPGNITALGWNARINDPQGDVVGWSTRDHVSGSLKADYDFGAVTLTSITGYADYTQDFYQDFDMTSPSVLEGYVAEQFETITEELRLTSTGDENLRWLVGAFFQHTSRQRETDVYLNVNAPPPVGGGAGAPGAKSLLQIADIISRRAYDAYAVFGQADYRLSEQLTATVGLRYDTEERSQRLPPGTPDVSFSSVQPKASLALRINPLVLTYVTVARGYRPGGFNDAVAFGAVYDKESLWSYELGVKSTLWRERVTLNAALYHEAFDDQQFFIVDGSGQQAMVNGDRSSITGAEIDLHARATARLLIGVGFGWNDTEIERFGDFPGSAFDTASFAGNRIPQVPEYNLSASVQHTARLSGALELQSRIDVRREGRIYWHPDNSTSRDAFTLTDLRLSLDGGAWRISLFGENVFDEHYIASQFDNAWTGLLSGVDIVWTPPPRTYGVEASVKF